MAQSRRLLLYTLPLALFILMAALLFSGIGKDPTLLKSQLVGKIVPEFQKKTLLNPNEMITNKDIHGPALINVFGTWCPACYHEHPLLIDIAQKEKVTIYGLNYNDKREDTIAYLNKLGNPYSKVIFDENGRLRIDLGVYGAPETFVIDKDNNILYRHVGVITKSSWESKIKPFLFSKNTSKSDNKSPLHKNAAEAITK